MKGDIFPGLEHKSKTARSFLFLWHSAKESADLVEVKLRLLRLIDCHHN